jgi:hypothetical protein
VNEDKFLESLESLFAAVVAKARADDAFARQLAKAVGDPKTLADAARRRSAPGAEAPKLDPRALFEAEGPDGGRRRLVELTRTQLLALVRAHDLAPEHTSKLNKSQLIEHIARAATPRRAAGKRAFDY